MSKFLLLFISLSVLVLPSFSWAKANNEIFNPSGLTMPRFVSLKSGKVFARKGPGKKYPIEWIYQKKGLPVKIVQEFDTWRKIEDSEGESAWVHQSLISGNRTALIETDKHAKIFLKNDDQSRVLAQVEKGNIVALKSCFERFCKVEILNYTGWMEKKLLWGLHESEVFQ